MKRFENVVKDMTRQELSVFQRIEGLFLRITPCPLCYHPVPVFLLKCSNGDSKRFYSEDYWCNHCDAYGGFSVVEPSWIQKFILFFKKELRN